MFMPFTQPCTFLCRRHCHVLRKRSLGFPRCHKHCPASSACKASVLSREVRRRVLEWIQVFQAGFLAGQQKIPLKHERNNIKWPVVAYDNATDKNCLKRAAYERENVNIAYLANIGYRWEDREGRYPSRWITPSNILIILPIIRQPNLITISVYIRNNSHPSLYTSNDVKFPSLVVRSSANSGYKGILGIGDYSSYSSFVTR